MLSLVYYHNTVRYTRRATDAADTILVVDAEKEAIIRIHYLMIKERKNLIAARDKNSSLVPLVVATTEKLQYFNAGW